MVDRFLLWIGAGAVCAGVTVGMLAGAGTAFAQTGSDGDGGASTSQSANSNESKQDSDTDGAEKNQPPKRNFSSETTDTKPTAAADDPDAKADADVDKVDKKDATEQTGRKSNRTEPGERTSNLVTNVISAVTPEPDRKVVFETTRRTDPVETPDPVEADPIQTEAVETESTNLAEFDRQQARVAQTNFVSQLAGFAPTRSDLGLATPMLAQPKITAAASPQIDVPPVISAIGTAIFGLIAFAESIVEGPPMALPGSGVTVRRSTLDLGDGHVVPADWYFPDTYDPESETPPERIIYLQHGFLARGVFYDYTASYLAKATDSVVVAPSLTSNIFATDGMWLGGDQMHRAVANLFVDDNDALLESAQAAGYTQDQMPQQVVLVGHSLGGGLVIDTARYMLANQESGDSTYHQLAGVLMLDGVSFTDPVPILEQLDGIPVYNLSATPYFWNLFGTMDAALAQVRSDEFHGAQQLGGLHSDAMIGGNLLIQFGAYVVTGFPQLSNVPGAQILAATWINDMFDGTPTPGFYGDPGDTLTIPTPLGPARALVQPQPNVIDTLARELTAVVFGLLAYINFATDVPAGQETGVLV